MYGFCEERYDILKGKLKELEKEIRSSHLEAKYGQVKRIWGYRILWYWCGENRGESFKDNFKECDGAVNNIWKITLPIKVQRMQIKKKSERGEIELTELNDLLEGPPKISPGLRNPQVHFCPWVISNATYFIKITLNVQFLINQLFSLFLFFRIPRRDEGFYEN